MLSRSSFLCLMTAGIERIHDYLDCVISETMFRHPHNSIVSIKEDRNKGRKGTVVELQMGISPYF